MKGLIGYTGFVGGNIAKQIPFDKLYNSKNISQIKGENFNLLICAGVSAEKYLANKFPENDLKQIQRLIEKLDTIECNKFILISTIDVYSDTIAVDEDTIINRNALEPYGKNRLFFEDWVRGRFDNHSVIRLPALFGDGLKKNFIYDCLTKIPTMIMKEKFEQLSTASSSDILARSYLEDANGNYKVRTDIEIDDKKELIQCLEELGFTSLVFTDSRSVFPFYYLGNIAKDIEKVIANNLKLVNFTSESLSASEIAKEVFGMDFINENPNKAPVKYDIKTIHKKQFMCNTGYMYSKKQCLKQIADFVGK